MLWTTCRLRFRPWLSMASWRAAKRSGSGLASGGGPAKQARNETGASQPGSSDQRPGPPTRGGAKDSEALLLAVAKLSLTHDQAIVDLQSMNFMTFLLPEASPLVGATKEAVQDFLAQVKDDPTKQLGPLHLTVAAALCEKLVEKNGAEATPEPILQATAVMETWLKRLENLDVPRVHEEVPHCRVAKARGEWKKLHIEIRQPEVRAAIRTLLLAQGAVHKLGVAPKGDLHRTIAKILDARSSEGRR